MSIPEAQLETWSHQGPTGQFTSTYDTIKTVLYDSTSTYASHSFNVFLQGSYKNDTNVYGDSDVDIVIRTTDVYYSDVSALTEEDRKTYESGFIIAPYQLVDFKRDVLNWLKQKYGSAVTEGSKAIHIAGSGARRKADVIVSAEFRDYKKYRCGPTLEYEEGMCFFLANGTQIVNYPKQHSENCTSKNQSTAWFKRTARTYKNLRNKMIADGRIEDGLAPSYFLEGLLYNVPVDRFGGSHVANFNDTLNWLVQADRSKFLCANLMFYLFHSSSPVTWRDEKCNTFLDAAVTLRDNW